MGLKAELKSFLDNHFPQLKLKSPLFYNWPTGIRFNLQTEPAFTNEYFEEVTRRATALFESAFEKNDIVIALYWDLKIGKSKIRKGSFWFKCFESIIDSAFSITMNPYQRFYRRPYCNQSLIKVLVQDINHPLLFKTLAYKDVPYMKNYEVYLINLDKKLIFRMYDDRGLDIIGDKEVLKKFYIKHNDLILDYDRKQIDAIFN